MTKRLFKKSEFEADWGDKYDYYEPTINKKEGKLISDSYRKKSRESKGSFDSAFMVLKKKRR